MIREATQMMHGEDFGIYILVTHSLAGFTHVASTASFGAIITLMALLTYASVSQPPHTPSGSLLMVFETRRTTP
jgi:hypothetical protein